MKAAVVNEWGQAPVYTEHSDPEASDGAQVAVVEASAAASPRESTMPAREFNYP
jgi:hypothetical protein